MSSNGTDQDSESGSDPATSEIGYSDALEELNEILDALEDDEIDIDVLSDRVERAAELIAVCRSRISDAEAQVSRIVAGFETGDSSNSNPIADVSGEAAEGEED